MKTEYYIYAVVVLAAILVGAYFQYLGLTAEQVFG